MNVASATRDSAPPHVLVVDDEETILQLVRGYLEREGMTVSVVGDGAQAVAMVRELAPDVVILDLMLPGLDGVEVCRQLRTFTDAYVLMLSARDEEVDRIVGLSVGADDYLTKPFSPRELVARVKALLRRPRSGPARTTIGADGLAIDLGRREVRRGDEPIRLTLTEFELLAALARDPGVVVSRQELLDRVWGVDYYGGDHVLDVHIGNLRRKLGEDPDQPRWIETVRGVGFRFAASS